MRNFCSNDKVKSVWKKKNFESIKYDIQYELALGLF